MRPSSTGSFPAERGYWRTIDERSGVARELATEIKVSRAQSPTISQRERAVLRREYCIRITVTATPTTASPHHESTPTENSAFRMAEERAEVAITSSTINSKAKSIWAMLLVTVANAVSHTNRTKIHINWSHSNPTM